MYWLRTGFTLSLLFYGLLTAGWWLGGWLLATHAFRLRRGERLLAGLGIGWLLFITFSNLIANLIQAHYAFWIGGILVLAAGVGVAWQSKRRPWLETGDWCAWPLLLILAGFTLLFTFILRGLSIFDEYLHIPLVSIMAAGDIPPHFYLNPDFKYAYHYGLQVWAASLVRLGGLFVWSAWDISRAFSIALTAILGCLWVRRMTRSRLAGFLGAFLLVFGGGARWLLRLLPLPWQNWVGSGIQLVNSGEDTALDLVSALTRPWIIEGDGPVPFPFAFHNGIFVPVMFAFGSTGGMPYLTILLLALLAPRRRYTKAGWLIWALLFASLALSAEHYFAFTWAGIALAVGITCLIRWRKKLPLPGATSQWLAILAVSAGLAAVQGGFVTETIRGWLLPALGQASQSYHVFGFAVRWPPALLSAHLGELSLLNGKSALALLAELGPVILWAPLVSAYLWRRSVRQNGWTSGLILGSFISLAFPILVRYGVDRSITRMPATALWTWLVIGFPVLWRLFTRGRLPGKIGLTLGYTATVMGGLIIFGVQLAAIRAPQLTYFIDGLDARISQAYWNRLEPGAQVFDVVAERSVALFGNAARTNLGVYEPLPEWVQLTANPDPVQIARAGFDYFYIDSRWWEQLQLEKKQMLQQPCIAFLAEQTNLDGDFKRLLSIRDCR